jgi:hypothetical protein
MSERLLNGYLIDVERYQTVNDGYLMTEWRYSVKRPDRETVEVGDGFDTSQDAKAAATQAALLCAARSRQESP